MNRSRIIFIIIILIVILGIYLLITYQDRKIKQLENQTTEDITEPQDQDADALPPEEPETKRSSAFLGFGWILFIISIVVIAILISKGRGLGEFDYETFVKEMRKKYDVRSQVHIPLKTVVGCDYGFIKGKKGIPRVLITFSSKRLPTINFEGEIPRYRTHSFLVDPTNMKVHSYIKNKTHSESLLYMRNVEFRSTGHPHGPHETPSVEDKFAQEIYQEGFKRGLGGGIEE